MYRRLIRPLLFLINPESVHHLIVSIIHIIFRIPGIPALIRNIYTVKNRNLNRELFGLKFTNPVGLAAGFDKNAAFFREFMIFGFGFIEIGTVTPLGQPGNPKPRLFRIPKDQGLINRMGFNNLGLDAAIKKLKKKPAGLIIGGNIGKNTLTPNDKAVEDYAKCFDGLYPYVDYFVVNVSCPNISDLSELQDKELLRDILIHLKEIRGSKAVRKPILVKISPDLNFAQIDNVLELIFLTGMDGIVATNTTTSRENLLTSPELIEKIGNGGLSGEPLKTRSTEIIKYIYQKSGGKIAIIGSGGIMSPEDAIEKINAGAQLLEIYTGFIYNGPGIIKRINKALSVNNKEVL
jgi:dihydroorotate dehydrogenase